MNIGIIVFSVFYIVFPVCVIIWVDLTLKEARKAVLRASKTQIQTQREATEYLLGES